MAWRRLAWRWLAGWWLARRRLGMGRTGSRGPWRGLRPCQCCRLGLWLGPGLGLGTGLGLCWLGRLHELATSLDRLGLAHGACERLLD